jgi:hypothetical protein
MIFPDSIETHKRDIVKKWLKIIAISLIVVFLALKLNQIFLIGCGFYSKTLCSSVFVSGRDPQSVMKEDLAFHPLMKLVKARIDYNGKSVTSSFLGLGVFKRKAIFIERIGSVLLSRVSENAVRNWSIDIPYPMPDHPESVPWPSGDLLTGVPYYADSARVNEIVNQAFVERNPRKPTRTRALIVLYKGRLIAEKYAPGFNKDTPLIGYSMKKSTINALIGILVKQGKISIYDPAPVPEWNADGDPRKAITTDQLLRMTSGLKFSEGYETNPLSDVNTMLFMKPDMAAYAARKSLQYPPNTRWHYSSGTSNILARIIRHTIHNQKEYFGFPRRYLFNKIGMRSALLEPDASGTYVNMYATARDWSRFGLLYLNDGIWEGERILPEGWVSYSKTPTLDGTYGAQFWVGNRGISFVPPDIFYALGYQGQVIVIIPSRELVVVRLGMTQRGNWDFYTFVKELLKAL